MADDARHARMVRVGHGVYALALSALRICRNLWKHFVVSNRGPCPAKVVGLFLAAKGRSVCPATFDQGRGRHPATSGCRGGACRF